MPDDDDLQRQTFREIRPPEETAAGAAAAALAAFVSGAVMRATEVIALADELGVATFPFESTCIEELRYHIASGRLEVDFTDGSQYDYPSVSMFNLLRWLNAPSKGYFFNIVVRGKWG